jgi:hypothetical protein
LGDGRPDHAAVTWVWAPRTAAGESLARSEGFESQSLAEAWMGSNWEALAAAGATSASLEHDGEVVYEMGLAEE